MYCVVVISSDNKWLLNSVVCAHARVSVDGTQVLLDVECELVP